MPRLASLIIALLFMHVSRSQEISLQDFLEINTVPSSFIHPFHSKTERIYEYGNGLEFMDSFKVEQNVYDSNGLILLRQRFGRILQSEDTYFYDAQNKLQRIVKEAYRSGRVDSTMFEYEYDSLARRTAEYIYNSDTTFLSVYTMTYNENNKVMNIYIKARDSSVFSLWQSYSYDFEGKLLGVEIFDQEGWFSIISYQLDSNNRMNKSVLRTREGSVYQTEYIYYEANGRLKMIRNSELETTRDKNWGLLGGGRSKPSRVFSTSEFEYYPNGFVFQEKKKYNKTVTSLRRHYYSK